MSQTSEVLTGIFNWIISVSIMATITVVFIMLIQRILHNRIKPRWHYLMWLLVLVRLLLPWRLESELSIYNWLSYPDSIQEIDSAVEVGTLQEVTGSGAAENLIYKYAMSIWLLGIILFAVYTFIINRKFALKISNETRPITDHGIIQLFAQSKELMSIHKPVTLVVSDKLTMPTLFGFRKPCLVIPQTVINKLNHEQLRHVFLHELAHCKRNDIGFNWLMQFMLIIHWFNPVLWYAHQRMREDQEIASDALALSYMEPASRENYGYTLIQLLESYVRPVSVPGNVHLSGNKSQLKRRIRMIKQFQFHSYRWSFIGLAAVVIISGCSLTNASVDKKSAAATDVPVVDQQTTTKVADVVTTSPSPSPSTTPSPSPSPTPTVESTTAPVTRAVGESRTAPAPAQVVEGARTAPVATQEARTPRTAPAPTQEARTLSAAPVATQEARTPRSAPAAPLEARTPSAAPVAARN